MFTSITTQAELAEVYSKNQVVLFFRTPEQEECEKLIPYFEGMKPEYRSVRWLSVDFTQPAPLVEQFQITETPTVIVHAIGGRVVRRVVGFSPEGVRAGIVAAIKMGFPQPLRSPNVVGGGDALNLRPSREELRLARLAQRRQQSGDQ